MTGISRRGALKALAAASAAPVVLRFDTPAVAAETDYVAMLPAIAEVVLPSECDRAAATAAFVRWIKNYKEGADTDHGYGSTRIRVTGPSPAQHYPAQAEMLDAAAREQGAARFSTASLEQRRAILEAALVAARIERLPARPNGGHLAADLMGHYFSSSDASDVCYRAAIGRDSCRGLPGSENRPEPRASRT